jgi:hypothetical protein
MKCKYALIFLFLVLAICDRERTGTRVGKDHSKSVRRSHLQLRADADRKRDDIGTKKNRATSIRPRSRRGIRESEQESCKLNDLQPSNEVTTGSRAQNPPDHGKSNGKRFDESNSDFGSESNAKTDETPSKRKETIWASSSDMVHREDLNWLPPPKKASPPNPKVCAWNEMQLG